MRNPFGTDAETLEYAAVQAPLPALAVQLRRIASEMRRSPPPARRTAVATARSDKPEGVGIRGAGSAQPEPPKGKLRGEVRPGGPFMREHRRAEAEMAAQMAQPEPTLAGWKFEKASHHQAFETYLVQAPNGYTAVVSALDRNPANVLFLLAKTMVRALAAITPTDPARSMSHPWGEPDDSGPEPEFGDTVHPTERSVSSPEAADVEIRLDADGSLDEIVGGTGIHLEQMDTNHWWMAVYYPEGRVTVNFHARGKITANVERERDDAAIKASHENT